MKILLHFFRITFCYLGFLFIASIITGCANVVAPTGGEKDIEPPRPVSFSPESLTTHFKGREIKISFDENFSLNNPSSEIYLSPTSSEKLRYKIKHKHLFVTLPDSLKENTTYTLHFGNSIADITEGNKIEGLTYVFSTGEVIDSFRIQGVLKDALTLKPDKNFLVMLYSDANDSAVAKIKPAYFTRTDENGVFVLSYLHYGTYRLFCLNDKNLDYLYDQPEEEVAFIDTLITVNDSIDFYSMFSFIPDQKKTVLLSVSNSENNKIAFAFNHPVSDILPKIISDSTKILFQSHSRNNDTIFVWYESKQRDSVYCSYTLDGKIDTIGIRMKVLSSQKGIAPVKFSMRSNLLGTKNNYSLSSEKNLEFHFNYPIQKVRKDLFAEIRSDSTSEIRNGLLVLKIDSLTGLRYSVLDFDFEKGKNYSVTIPKNYFTDIFGNSNDSLVLHFKKSEEISTGNLHLEIMNEDTAHHYFAELVSGKTVIKHWQISSGKNICNITAVTPSTYRLRFVRDDNENDKWDAGDYWLHVQPEKVTYAAKDIVVRANWDMEAEAVIVSPKVSELKGIK